jgi:hypothetical protein
MIRLEPSHLSRRKDIPRRLKLYLRQGLSTDIMRFEYGPRDVLNSVINSMNCVLLVIKCCLHGVNARDILRDPK